MARRNAPTKQVSLPQEQEVPVTMVTSGRWAYRYAYARSADTRSAGDRGQDYVTFMEGDSFFAFALCDGVSQSFYGDLAARLLGSALLGRLLDGLPATLDPQAMSEAILAHLNELTAQATRAVEAQDLPGDIPEMLRQVLEQKRSSGSDSTFVCGRVDRPGGLFPEGRVVLAWMGDSRLRVWGPAGGERTAELGDSFKTEERWSSVRGPVNGEPHVVVSPLVYKGKYVVSRILAYSDGLSTLDPWGEALATEDLQLLVDATGGSPTSDDISLLELWTDAAPKLLPPGRVQPLPEISTAAGDELSAATGLAGLYAQPNVGMQRPAPGTAYASPPAWPNTSRPAALDSGLYPSPAYAPTWTAAPRGSVPLLRVIASGMVVLGLALLCGLSAALALPAGGPWHMSLFGPTATVTPDVRATATAETQATATSQAQATMTSVALNTAAAQATMTSVADQSALWAMETETTIAAATATGQVDATSTSVAATAEAANEAAAAETAAALAATSTLTATETTPPQQTATPEQPEKALPSPSRTAIAIPPAAARPAASQTTGPTATATMTPAMTPSPSPSPIPSAEDTATPTPSGQGVTAPETATAAPETSAPTSEPAPSVSPPTSTDTPIAPQLQGYGGNDRIAVGNGPQAGWAPAGAALCVLGASCPLSPLDGCSRYEEGKQ